MVLVVSSSSRAASHESVWDSEKPFPLLLFLTATTFSSPVHSGVHQQHCSLISQGNTVTMAQLKPSTGDFWLALPFRKWSVNNKDNSFILFLGVFAFLCWKKRKRKKPTERENNLSEHSVVVHGISARLWWKPLVFLLTYCHPLAEYSTNVPAITERQCSLIKLISFRQCN